MSNAPVSRAPTKYVRGRVIEALACAIVGAITPGELAAAFEELLIDFSGGPKRELDLTDREERALREFIGEYLDRYSDSCKDYTGLFGRFKRWLDYSNGEPVIGREELLEEARRILAEIEPDPRE